MQEFVNTKQLEFLMQLGQEEETVNILGTKFTFRTLTVDENSQAFENPSKENLMDETAKYNSMRIEVLARAIMRINDIAIPDTMKDKVKIILRRSQQAALNRLWACYVQLLERQDKKFKGEEEELDKQTPSGTVQMPRPPEAIAAPVPPPPAAPVAPPRRVVAMQEDEDGAVDLVNPNDLVGPQ